MLVDATMLREFKIFEELNDRELEQIAKGAKIEELGPGATLTEAGAPANRLYLIVEGRVTVNVQGPQGRPSERTNSVRDRCWDGRRWWAPTSTPPQA